MARATSKKKRETVARKSTSRKGAARKAEIMTKEEINPQMSLGNAFVFRFTPSLMQHEALESILVQREPLVGRVVELIRESASKKSKHHTLLIGPRGTGKTHFASIVYHRVKAMKDLDDRLVIAWLREDEWGITSFLDLLMRIFRAIIDERKDKELDQKVEALYSLPQNEIQSAALGLLKKYIGKRTLLVIVENLDDIFQGLGDEGQKRLRAYIQENSFFTIMATAQSLFNGVSLQTSPFYGFFRIHHLEALSFEDSVQLLKNIAELRGDHELASFIQTATGRARIRAVNHLAGGNHRVYIIFSQFLTRESLDELVTPFMRMLDDLTPYYQERMRWLSPQQRKIVEFLSNRRGAATVKEIAQRCFMTHQTASSQLMSLREMEYVQSTQVGRESYYELREPLMRICVEVKKSKGGPIQLFIDFLRLWYSRPELQQRLDTLPLGAELEREYLIHVLKEIEQYPNDPRVDACLKDARAYIEANDIANVLKTAEELVAIRGEGFDWWLQGFALYGLRKYEESLAAMDKTIEKGYDLASAWSIRGMALTQSGRYEDALSSLDKAETMGEMFPGAEMVWAEALIGSSQWEKGVTMLETAFQRSKEISYDMRFSIYMIVYRLFTNTKENRFWHGRIKVLISIFEKNEQIPLLAAAWPASIGGLIGKVVSRELTQRWLDIWSELAGNNEIFQLPLRLFDLAVRYIETNDERILLEIPVEERTFLQSVLKEQTP